MHTSFPTFSVYNCFSYSVPRVSVEFNNVDPHYYLVKVGVLYKVALFLLVSNNNIIIIFNSCKTNKKKCYMKHMSSFLSLTFCWISVEIEASSDNEVAEYQH